MIQTSCLECSCHFRTCRQRAQKLSSRSTSCRRRHRLPPSRSVVIGQPEPLQCLLNLLLLTLSHLQILQVLSLFLDHYLGGNLKLARPLGLIFDPLLVGKRSCCFDGCLGSLARLLFVFINFLNGGLLFFNEVHFGLKDGIPNLLTLLHNLFGVLFIVEVCLLTRPVYESLLPCFPFFYLLSALVLCLQPLLIVLLK